MPVCWDFSNPAISSAPAGWSISLGTASSYNYAFGIGDNVSCKFDNTGEFIQVYFNASPSKITYYMSPQNSGSPWGGQFDVLESANGSTWTTVHTFTYKASTSSTYTNCKFIDNLQANSRYVRFQFTTKQTGGSGVAGGNVGIDSVYIFSGSTPVIGSGSMQWHVNGINRVNDEWIPMPANDSLNGYILNSSTTDTLKIDSIRAINGTMYSNSAFAWNVSLPLKINPMDSVRFLIRRVNTGILGDKNLRLLFHSNDVNRLFAFIRVQALEGNYRSEPIQWPEWVVLKDTTSYSFTVQTKQSIPEPIDSLPARLLVLLKDAPITENPVNGVSYVRGNSIGSAKVLAIDSGTFLPAYILANKTYYIKTIPYRGSNGTESYAGAHARLDSIHTFGSLPGNYYAGINPANSNFVSALSAKINYHDTFTYANYVNKMIYPWLARDTLNGQHVVYCVYTGVPYVYASTFNWWNGSNGGIHSREHTYPQSWMPSNTGTFPTGSNGKELPEYNDMHHLFPADQVNANGVRSNYPLGEVLTITKLSPNGAGKFGKDAYGNTVYEPRDSHKGDAARALLYMAVCYNGVAGRNWSFSAYQDTTVLLKWHRQDPPDAHEIARNEYIASIQHNRNPFIDFPQWADRVNFKTMGYIPETVCATPSALRVSNISSNSLQLNWDTVANALSYQVYFKPSNASNYIAYSVNNASVNKVFSSLNASTMYDMQVQAVCANKSSIASTVFSVTMPGIRAQTNALTYCVNDSIHLSVQLAGNYAYTYQWYKQGLSIPGATQSTWNIPHAQVSDTGKYWVKASWNGLIYVSDTIPVRIASGCNPSTSASIRVLAEGFWENGSMKPVLQQAFPNAPQNISDSIQIEMVDSITHAWVFHDIGMVDSSGWMHISFPDSLIGHSCFIRLTFRNAIAVWSHSKIIQSTWLVDLTKKENCIGENVRNLGNGLFAAYSGDIDGNGVINNDDMVLLDNDNSGMNSGYIKTDLNGDGLVTNDDIVLLDNNNAQFIAEWAPF